MVAASGVDEPEPVLVAVLDAGLVRGPLVLGVLVGPRRRRGQHALHVPPRQIGIRLEHHRHDAGDERGRVGRAHAGVATVVGEAVGERLRGEHAVVVLRVAAGRADEDRRAGRRVGRVLEVLAERADAHREPGVLVALVVHVLADVVRVARREDKDHAQAAAAVRHAVEHRVVAVARHLAEAALHEVVVQFQAGRRVALEVVRAVAHDRGLAGRREITAGPVVSVAHVAGAGRRARGARERAARRVRMALAAVVAPAVGGDVVDVVVFRDEAPVVGLRG